MGLYNTSQDVPGDHAGGSSRHGSSGLPLAGRSCNRTRRLCFIGVAVHVSVETAVERAVGRRLLGLLRPTVGLGSHVCGDGGSWAVSSCSRVELFGDVWLRTVWLI
jgi:hypothetical protein